ncbi:DUF805 domain-containing protein [Clostridium sp. ZS2-4]|uniref:DUF805 domain-containing protein n=1 Tax=Clostridium sp. ZS2-4 TaxID=2987703 RepID=UPI00227B5AF5|nr:DUF805 domain-containing protein [Clostridium sp. ZS2-4]MCY6355665.1 DUF805 domain-containing protein [Clostridium sp. ZS2-4]
MKTLFSFKGNANRLKYHVYSALGAFSFVIIIFLSMFINNSFTHIISIIAYIGFLIIYVCLTVQRLHDLGRPGYHFWLLLIPFYGFYVLCLLAFKKGVVVPDEH